MASETRHSVLDAEHRALGARMTPFGGWEMPLQYQGVLEEHHRCRNDAVVFDVSHLGGVTVSGPGALAGLQGLFTNDLTRIAPGRAQYTHLLDEVDAHVLDDIIVWWRAEDDFLVIPNAANTGPALAAMREAVPDGVVTDVTPTRAFLAVQGPQARRRLEDVLPAAADVGHFAVGVVPFADAEVIVGGTGYTGEDGVELHVPDAVATDLWRALLDAGVSPAGLGARDTLRLEMGYPLHGHELGPGITPLQAGLGWVVAWEKGDFRGRVALERERDRGVARRLRGIRTESRSVPRSGCTVLVDGKPAGEVVSGNFSPTLERGIGLAFLPPDVEPDTRVEVDIRGRAIPAVVVAPPFIERPREG
jgi:aminomethyltransferase